MLRCILHLEQHSLACTCEAAPNSMRMPCAHHAHALRAKRLMEGQHACRALRSPTSMATELFSSVCCQSAVSCSATPQEAATLPSRMQLADGPRLLQLNTGSTSSAGASGIYPGPRITPIDGLLPVVSA